MNAILILDLDNTILSDKEHPNLLVKRLNLLRTYGKLILATGRNFQNFITNFNWNDISNLIDVGIFSNGGEVVTKYNFERTYFNKSAVHLLIEMLAERKYITVVQKDFKKQYSFDYFLENNIASSNITRFKILDKKFYEDYELQTLISSLEIQACYSPDGIISLFPAGVNKGLKVKNFIKDTKNTKILAFGDGNNDLSMKVITNANYIRTKDRGNDTFNYLLNQIRRLVNE